MVNRHVSGKAHKRMKERIVEVPMAFYTCRIKLHELAEMAIAVSNAAVDKSTWGGRRRRSKADKQQQQHGGGNGNDTDDGGVDPEEAQAQQAVAQAHAHAHARAAHAHAHAQAQAQAHAAHAHAQLAHQADTGGLSGGGGGGDLGEADHTQQLLSLQHHMPDLGDERAL
jgi:hypothetical protein